MSHSTQQLHISLPKNPLRQSQQLTKRVAQQWRRPEYSFGGLCPGGSGDGSPPVWSTGETSKWSCGQSPPEAICRYCLQILTAETIKIWNRGIEWQRESWAVCFMVGAKWHFVGPSRQTHAWQRHCCSVGVNPF